MEKKHEKLFIEEASAETEISVGFADLGLSDQLVNATKAAGFMKPSDIQTQAIPHILAKKDVIAQAQTGSGKTAAYILPALQGLKFDGSNEVLVLVPTRELAEQVVEEIARFGKVGRVRAACVIGGKPPQQQIDALNRGAEIVVATPGRLLDHLGSKRLRRFAPTLVVLDEADEILARGFIDDIKEILRLITGPRQTLLFSATMPKPIAALAKTELTDPVHICLVKKELNCHVGIDQSLYVVREHERVSALIRLIRFENPTKSVIFCRTKRDADDLCRSLNDQGLETRTLHGDMSQAERQRVMQQIKSGELRILIATDIASRGIDIEDLSHVFNFHVPENAERYVHRIGRTGRAGRLGKALTIVTEREWQNHIFFTSTQSKHLRFATIPSRESVEAEMNSRFLDEVSKVKVQPAVIELCQKFTRTLEPFELLCRLYSYTKGETAILGPDKIGLSASEMSRLGSAKKTFGNKFRGERRFRSAPPRRFSRNRS